MSEAVIRDTPAGARRLGLRAPEHVELDLELADLANRLGALLIDVTAVGVGLVAIVLSAVFLFSASAGESATMAFAVLVAFLWRNFYFTASEVLGQGRTLGKHLLRLRVVARDGGPLTVEQVFARNLTRDLEIFLPLTLLFSPGQLVPGGPWWVQLATAAWILILALLPFTNRHRARLGDLVAGTLVVVEPTGTLLEDLLGRPSHGPRYHFTGAQLDIYGIRELQVLEEVLRRPPSDEKDRLVTTIAEKVQDKIGWHREAEEVVPRAFLEAFYAAQRQRLEHKMLMGKRQERKLW